MGFDHRRPARELGDLFVIDKSVVKEFLPERWNERIERDGQYAGKGFGPSTTSGPKLLRHISRVKMPTLVIWGKEGKVLPVGLSGLWERAIPHAAMRIVENAGPLLLDESKEARNAVRAFLA